MVSTMADIFSCTCAPSLELFGSVRESGVRRASWALIVEYNQIKIFYWVLPFWALLSINFGVALKTVTTGINTSGLAWSEWGIKLRPHLLRKNDIEVFLDC